MKKYKHLILVIEKFLIQLKDIKYFTKIDI